jgi:lipoprotein-anchoring transpeptidase ErfK/SrfK
MITKEMSIVGEKNDRNKIIIGITIFICTLTSIYFVISVYFTNHFYFGSEINQINVSGKTIDQVKDQMASRIKAYTLALKERGGKSEQISGIDISLILSSGGQYKSFKDRQNPFKWITAFFNTEDYKMIDAILYDKKLLYEKLEKLSCFDSKSVIEPKNPVIKYTDNGYVIVDEVNGNKINKDILYNHVVKAILNEEATLDLEYVNCYEHPKYTSNSTKVIQCKNILDKYLSSKITYTFGNRKETIDGSIINKWLKISKDFEVIVDMKKEKDYVSKLFNTYNTIGRTRNFVTTWGKTIKISGGDYGWWINTVKEVEALNTAIKEGQTITKEPAYIQTASCHGYNDIGSNYVEIDLTKQHLWFYKNGSLIIHGDIVSGNVSRNHKTPAGIYRLKYKETNVVLKGQDYNTTVNFWMPFNGDIGVHDANWRSKFGGNEYKTNGSHGCINSPYYLAKEIFYKIETNTAIICYY